MKFMKITPFPDQTTPESNRFVDDYLLYELAVASQLLSDEFHRYVKSQGVKIHCWRVLACLIDQPGLMLTDLSHLVLFEQSRLTKIIDQMAADELVSKQSDPKDRRKTALSVTQKGADIVGPLIIKAKEHEARALSVLTARERVSFKKTLRKLGKIHGSISVNDR